MVKRIQCAEEWESSDPLVEMHNQATGNFQIRWAVDVEDVRVRFRDLSPTMLIEKHRTAGQIHKILRVAVPAEPSRYAMAFDWSPGISVEALAHSLASLRAGDRINTVLDRGITLLELGQYHVRVHRLQIGNRR